MLSDLTARHAKAADKAYTIADTDGLSLHVSTTGFKSWHFRFTYAGKRRRMSFGPYPAISLKDARTLRDEAHTLLVKGINPQAERDRKHRATIQAGEHTFMAIYEQWLDYRRLFLEEGRQTSLSQIARVFRKDVFPALRALNIHEVTRAHLLDIISKVERRGSLSVAEKLRTWFGQLFTYATVVVPGMGENPSTGLSVVAVPLPPVKNNPFLRMPELPLLLRTLRRYRGRLNTQLGLRLLLLTGVRGCELRLATPEQFDLERGLWLIPVVRLKQRKQLARKHRKRIADIPPYVVPLPVQAQEIVRHQLDHFKPAQVYLLPSDWSLKKPLSENTFNNALKRMGYEGQLTAHGIRATISTALNELGYPKNWIDAQLSHVDPDKTSASYNHAEYIEQRRVMMQDWADRLDLFEQEQVAAASTHLTITLQGLPTVINQEESDDSQPNALMAPQLIVTTPTANTPQAPRSTQRLSGVHLPEYARPQLSAAQREQRQRLEEFEAPHNLPVAEYAKLVGKSRRWISYEIQAGNLLSIHMGHKGQRVPDWHLDPTKRQLIHAILRCVPRGLDPWHIYYALIHTYSELGSQSAVHAVKPTNLRLVAQLVAAQSIRAGHADYP